MKKSKKLLVKDKKWESTEEIANFFKLISEKIASKKITLVQGPDETSIELPERVLLSVAASEKETRKGLSHKINFKLSWVDGQPGGQLTIK